MTPKVTLARWTQSSGPLWLWLCFKVEFKPSLDYLKKKKSNITCKEIFLRFKPQAPAHERDPSRPTIKGTRGIKVIRQWQSFGRGGPRWPPLPGGISDRGLGWRRFPSFEEGRRIWAGDRGPNMGNWLTPRRETKTRRGHTIHSLRPNPLRRARGQTHIFLRILTTSLFVTCLFVGALQSIQSFWKVLLQMILWSTLIILKSLSKSWVVKLF